MKRISFLLAALLLIVSACNRHNNQNVTINGVLPNAEFEGMMVYLSAMGEDGLLDSAVVKDGKFQFVDTLDMAKIGVIRTPRAVSGIQYHSTLVLENGTIYIDLETDSLSGTALNDSMYCLFTNDSRAKEFEMLRSHALEAYYNAATAEARHEAELDYDQIDSALNHYASTQALRIYNSHQADILGAYALYVHAQSSDISYEDLDQLMSKAEAVVTTFAPLCKLHSRLYNVANTSEGKTFTDIEGIDFVTGEPTKLSAMLGESEATIIDFWASWCGPCRQEIKENLIRLYDAYKDKGLNIIGVDVWDKIPDHKTAVENMGIQYPQLIDTTRTATDNYGVEGIPTILLLDKNGTIVRRGIRGEQIEEAVVELLKINE